MASPLSRRPREDHACAAIGPLCEALAGHDVIVVIGAPVFRYYPYVAGDYIPAGASLFQITDDPSEAARAPIGASVLADPGRSCAVLADEVPQSTRTPPSCPQLPVTEQTTKITAERLYQAIEETRPKDSIIVQESLSTLKALRLRIPTSSSRSFFSMSSGVLGYGLPAAVGVALAERDEDTNRKVIAIIGDGAANYVIQAIWTAVQHKLPILFIIPCNGAYNILKAFANQLRTPGVPGLDVPGLDFVSLAAGYGCLAERVTAEGDLAEVLRRGLDMQQPYLLAVDVDAMVPELI